MCLLRCTTTVQCAEFTKVVYGHNVISSLFLEADEQVPGGSPRRHRAPSIPRNAEELASHLLHGSLRMTPSRQQILSYSGIRLEERASAFQREREQREAKEREAVMQGHGRLHSSSDSMLLQSTSLSNRPRPRLCSSEPAPETDGRESEGSDDSSSTESNQSSDEEEEDEEVLVKTKSHKKQEKQEKPGDTSGIAEEQEVRTGSSLPRPSTAEKPKAEPRGRKKVSGNASRKRKSVDSKKVQSNEQKFLQRTGEGEEEGVSLGSPHRGRPSKGAGGGGPKTANPRPSEKSRRRLRSMDTVSSDSAVEDDEMNGDVFPSHQHRLPQRTGRPSRQSRSISSSSVFEESVTRRGPSKSAARVSSATRGRRSSCFSDSEVKDYETTPGVPSTSSNEDLTVSGGQLLKGGGRPWRKKLGLKRNLSVSSLEDGDNRKRAREESESSDGGGDGLGGVSNGMMNGGQDIKPMELVWAKCRGYPPYPALVSPVCVCVRVERLKLR